MKFKLKTKYSIVFVSIIITVVIVLAGSLLYQFRLSLYRFTETSSEMMSIELLEQMKKRGEVITRLLAENLINPLYNYDMQAIYELLIATKAQKDVLYTYVYDTDGKIVHDGIEGVPGFGNELNDKASRRAIHQEGRLLIQVRNDILDVSLPLWVGKTPLGGIKVVMSLKSIKKEISIMENRLNKIRKGGLHQNIITIGIITLLLIIFSVFVSLFISKRLSRPIREVAWHAMQVGQGNFDLQISSTRSDEIGDLINAFNQMGQDIKRTTISINELEKRISERTEELAKANRALRIEISEREIAQEELVQAKEFAELANRTKSEFLSNMSHELRTPLNHIIGFTELIVDKKFGDLNETQDDYLNDVLDSSHHLLSLINDILDLSKVEAGKMQLEPTDVNLRLLLENSLLMLKEKAVKHRLQVSTDIKGIPETIKADERKLKQIMLNLLSNAVKFTPDGGDVIVSARMANYIARPGLRYGNSQDLHIIEERINRNEVSGTKLKGSVEISVSDTGIGIRPDDQASIFNPFEQADGSTSRRHQGTGLGLSLTKSLVELHGGRIWVESEGEGKGSSFRFVIPV